MSGARAVLGALSASLLLGASAPATLDAPALRLLTLDGEPVTLAEALGDEAPTTIVFFWSLYQPDSRRALRALDQLATSGTLEVPVLAIEVPEYREGPDKVADFVGRAGVRLPVLFDPDGAALHAAGRVSGGGDRMPATYLLRAGGELELIASRWLERYAELVRERVSAPGATRP